MNSATDIQLGKPDRSVREPLLKRLRDNQANGSGIAIQIIDNHPNRGPVLKSRKYSPTQLEVKVKLNYKSSPKP